MATPLLVAVLMFLVIVLCSALCFLLTLWRAAEDDAACAQLEARALAVKLNAATSKHGTAT